MRAKPSIVGRMLTQVLTHPITMAAKAPVRDMCWTLRGRTLANPRLPSRITSLLFVCKGNICRSPFAAHRASLLLRDGAVTGIECLSAGISTTQADWCPAEAREVGATFGVSLYRHQPLQLTNTLIRRASVIVVMEAEQMGRLRHLYPEAADRIVLLPLYDGTHTRGYARYNIFDPFGQPADAFQRCYARIDLALRSFLHHVADARDASTPRPVALSKRIG
jgi:protein-tyrosine phosphatase